MDVCDKILEYTAPHYDSADYSALSSQYQEWVESKPLAGLRVLDATPLFRNTLLKYRNLLAAGADLTIGLSNIISHNEQALQFAKEELGLRATYEQAKYDIVLDCAGAFHQSEARIGYVELTRSGVEYYQNSEKPIFLADSSRIKEIETELGTGESLFRAMDHLGFKDYQGKNIVILGAGKVGRGIFREAKSRGCRIVVVAETNTATFECNLIDYKDRQAIHKAIQGAWAVVMATGVKGALGLTIDAQVAIESQAILINMGAEDEFGPIFTKERLLEGGRTLNFILDEPTHLRFIDPTMALHNFGAQFLVENSSMRGIIIPNEQVEEMILETKSNKLLKYFDNNQIL